MESSEQINDTPKRPVFLTVLCVLSFISVGYNLIGNIFNIINGPLKQDELEQTIAGINKLSNAFESNNNSLSELFIKLGNIIQYTNQNFYMHTSIMIATFSLGLYGVLKMYQGFKYGFHAYIVYNLISIVSIYASVPPSEVPSFVVIFSVIFSALFIFLYSRNLHWMK